MRPQTKKDASSLKKGSNHFFKASIVYVKNSPGSTKRYILFICLVYIIKYITFVECAVKKLDLIGRKQQDKMKKELIKYTYRNITRKKKQTAFAVLCIMVSSFSILINKAMNNGIQASLQEAINEAISGQLMVYSTKEPQINILEAQLNEQLPFESTELETLLSETFDNITLNKRIRFGSLVSLEEETSYLNIHALEKEHLERVGNLLTFHSGKMPKQGKEIAISETMSDELKCNTGDTILLVATNINDFMSDELAVVSGVFEEKGIALYLNYSAFVTYKLGHELVQLEESENLELIINSGSSNGIPPQQVGDIEKLVKANCQDKNIHIASWEKTVPLFFTIAAIWKNSGYMIQVVFITFSLIILINLTSLIINSRKKEFGTLLALGFSWNKIRNLVWLEYLIVTISAFVFAYLLNLLFFYTLPNASVTIPDKDAQFALMTDSLRFFLKPTDVAYVLFLFCVTVLIAVFISIKRIKKTGPVKLIHNN